MITKTKILAVSSDMTLSRLMKQGFNSEDFETVCTEHTGYNLKSILQEENPDLVVLDIAMPNLDGIGTCLSLRQWTQVPIMMISTWDTEEGMVKGLNLGSESYLTEPFGIDELKTRMKDTLRRNAAAMTDPLMNTRTSLSGS